MSNDRLKGFAVVAMTEGLTLGHVAAALFDPATLALRAFRVAGDRQGFLLPLGGVATIGPDAIMVERSRATRPTTVAGDDAGLVELEALTHRKVVDAAGTLLGTLHDLEVDLATGAPLHSVGGDLITVDVTPASDGSAVTAVGAAANVARR